MKNNLIIALNAIEKKHDIELESHEVELGVSDDLRKAENELKTALLSFGDISDKYEVAKKTLMKQSDSAYKVALKYNEMANDLGLKAMDNVLYKTVDAYLQSDLIKNLK